MPHKIIEAIKKRRDTLRQNRRAFLKASKPTSWEFQVATWFGSGLLIPAPGTWGTLGGALFGLLLVTATGPIVTLCVAFMLGILGLIAIRKIESRMEEHDSSFIVIDEVVAILIVCSLLPQLSLLYILLGFLVFRFFDAAKPWPINWMDHEIGGAAGVMIDDLMAALYTLLVLWGLWILGGF